MWDVVMARTDSGWARPYNCLLTWLTARTCYMCYMVSQGDEGRPRGYWGPHLQPGVVWPAGHCRDCWRNLWRFLFKNSLLHISKEYINIYTYNTYIYINIFGNSPVSFWAVACLRGVSSHVAPWCGVMVLMLVHCSVHCCVDFSLRQTRRGRREETRPPTWWLHTHTGPPHWHTDQQHEDLPPSKLVASRYKVPLALPSWPVPSGAGRHGDDPLLLGGLWLLSHWPHAHHVYLCPQDVSQEETFA